MMAAADITRLTSMARWEPDARGRLEQAALALYAERGYEDTTVAEIAERAGLTERTFFRHFEDKREVLFSGASTLEERLMAPVANAPDSVAPIEAVTAGLQSAAALLQERREFARQRQAIIAASPELRERELIKFASLGRELAATLRRRGVSDPAASLTAEVALAVFRTAFERWIEDTSGAEFSQHIEESLHQLRALTVGPRPVVDVG